MSANPDPGAYLLIGVGKGKDTGTGSRASLDTDTSRPTGAGASKGNGKPRFSPQAGPEILRMVHELLDVDDYETLNEVVTAASAFGIEVSWGKGKHPGPEQANKKLQTLAAACPAPQTGEVQKDELMEEK